jgi:hypothetical protein
MSGDPGNVAEAIAGPSVGTLAEGLTGLADIATGKGPRRLARQGLGLLSAGGTVLRNLFLPARKRGRKKESGGNIF